MCGLLDRFSKSFFDLLDVLKTHYKVSPDFELDVEDRHILRLLLSFDCEDRAPWRAIIDSCSGCLLDNLKNPI